MTASSSAATPPLDEWDVVVRFGNGRVTRDESQLVAAPDAETAIAIAEIRGARAHGHMRPLEVLSVTRIQRRTRA